MKFDCKVNVYLTKKQKAEIEAHLADTTQESLSNYLRRVAIERAREYRQRSSFLTGGVA